MKHAAKNLLRLSAAGAGAYLTYDLIKNLSIRSLPDRPKSDEGASLAHELLLYLEHPSLANERGITIDDAYIQNALCPAKAYIDGRYDCQDFRMHSLLRLQYSHIDTIRSLSPAGALMLEDIFLNAKYWLTEPGADSLCTWSENHQLLYAVAEYLAGQMWQDRVFTNDGATGREHMARGKKRIEHWMRQRFLHGYSEYNSTNYYLYNVGPAANFIQFAAKEDAGLAERMRMCLDLLLFDVASNMYAFTYTAPTGRAYVDNMVGVTGDRVRRLIDFLWERNEDYKTETHQMLINFYAMYSATNPDGSPARLYEFPKVLYEIGLDKGPRVLKSSHSMDTSELPEKGYVGHADAQIMRQLSMECFTNPEVIYNSVTFFDKYKMFPNSFINYFKAVNLRLLKSPARLRWVSEQLNPMPNGIALQRANLYTYRTPNYQLMNIQRYHPGIYGAQQMLNALNFGERAVVFTAHPAKAEDAKSVSAYPGYWAGFGRAPHAVQHENVLLMLYKIPKTRGFLELYPVPQFTHTYLPEAYFDEVLLKGRHAFARHGNAFLALTGANPLCYKAFSQDSAKSFKNGLADHPGKRFDLIQEGNDQYWIYELSDASKEDFSSFCERIAQNAVAYDPAAARITYTSHGSTYKTSWDGAFFVNDVEQDLNHPRFSGDYSNTQREASEIRIDFAGHFLQLDYERYIRSYDAAAKRSD